MATGLPTGNNRPSLPDKRDTVFSPRVAALYHVSNRASVWGAANSAFRAPTLTELYRQFSVGAVTTFPNSEQGPERLVGGELGLNLAPVRNLTFRTTWFHNRVKDPIANVTQSAAFCAARCGSSRMRAEAEPRQDAGPRRADRRGVPDRHGLARGGRLHARRREGDRRRHGARAGRQVPPAGAEAPRLVPAVVFEREGRDGGAQRARGRAAVQRRSQRSAYSDPHARQRRLRIRFRLACPDMRSSISRLRAI